MTATEIPLKPFKYGAIASEFGGPAKSPKEVLERARVALAPRGSWKHGNYTGTTHEGHARCLVQTFNDVDGMHVGAAKKLLLRAVKEMTGRGYDSVERFNDAKTTKKHHVLAALDCAIEMA